LSTPPLGLELQRADLNFGRLGTRASPLANIGISEHMPPGFLQQLAWPFKTNTAEAG
jgi:hypothetical protein